MRRSEAVNRTAGRGSGRDRSDNSGLGTGPATRSAGGRSRWGRPPTCGACRLPTTSDVHWIKPERRRAARPQVLPGWTGLERATSDVTGPKSRGPVPIFAEDQRLANCERRPEYMPYAPGVWLACAPSPAVGARRPLDRRSPSCRRRARSGDRVGHVRPLEVRSEPPSAHSLLTRHPVTLGQPQLAGEGAYTRPDYAGPADGRNEPERVDSSAAVERICHDHVLVSRMTVRDK
jgi:hypothetical protein